jgi:hypothetical protein
MTSRYKNDEYREKHAAYAKEWRKSGLNKARNAEYQRRYKAKNPEKVKQIQESNKLRKYYGLTIVQRNAMFQAQGHRCAICRSAEPGRKNANWAVDHCHDTGKVRGILCHPCNAMLGYAKDNPATLTAAIEYLAAHPKPANYPQTDADTPPVAKDQLGLFERVA